MPRKKRTAATINAFMLLSIVMATNSMEVVEATYLATKGKPNKQTPIKLPSTDSTFDSF